MKAHKGCLLFGAIGAVVFVLTGCRAEEQGRITNYQPGVYLGKLDTKLTEGQRRQLRQRSVYQGSGVAGGGGGSSAGSRDVRTPEGSAIDLSQLMIRARNQGGP